MWWSQHLSGITWHAALAPNDTLNLAISLQNGRPTQLSYIFYQASQG